jgi:hypothetical protein
VLSTCNTLFKDFLAGACNTGRGTRTHKQWIVLAKIKIYILLVCGKSAGVEPFTVQWEQNTVQGDKKGIFELQFATAPRPNYADLWIQNLMQNPGSQKTSIKENMAPLQQFQGTKFQLRNKSKTSVACA